MLVRSDVSKLLVFRNLVNRYFFQLSSVGKLSRRPPEVIENWRGVDMITHIEQF